MPEPEPKLDDNSQFARCCDSYGDNPLGGAIANDGRSPLCDLDGRLIVVPFTGGHLENVNLSLADMGAAGLGLLVNAGETWLYQAWGLQTSGAQLYALVYNIAAGPPAGAPYIAPVPVPNNGGFSITFPPGGLGFSTGCFVTFSTTPFTYTAPGAGAGWISAMYR